jgi:hypothetical protein
MSDAGAAREGKTPGASRQRLRLLALGLAVTLLIALVALASRSSSAPGGDGPANAGPLIAIIHLVEIVGIGIELLAILLLIVMFRLTRREEGEDEPFREPQRVPWLLRVLMVVLPVLQIAAIAFALSRIDPQPLEQEPFGLAPSRPPADGFMQQVTANMGLAWWEIALAVALAAVAFIAILRAFRAPPARPQPEPDAPRHTGALASAVAAGLRDARREPDPRRAVIAAYATMEQMLAAQGLPRRAVEAPLEYMARLFAEIDISGDAMRTLTDLFELARFSHHVIEPAAKERAISALVAIENDLHVQTAR